MPWQSCERMTNAALRRAVAILAGLCVAAAAGCPTTLEPEVIYDPFEGTIRVRTPLNQDVFDVVERLEFIFYYTGDQPLSYVLYPPFSEHPLDDLARAEAGDVRLEVLGKREDPGSSDGWELIATGEATDFEVGPDMDVEVFLALKGQLGLLPGGLDVPRSDAAAVLMPDERVLVVGGLGSDGPVQRYEVLAVDRETLESEAGVVGQAHDDEPRVGLAAFLVEGTSSDLEGRVVVLGGDTECAAHYCFPVDHPAMDVLVFDAEADRFDVLDTLAQGTVGGRPVAIGGNRFAVVGGFNEQDAYNMEPLVFDASDGTAARGSGTAGEREQHTVTNLGAPGSDVLITGGVGIAFSGLQLLDTAQQWSPGTNANNTGPLVEARMRHTATLLGDGTVLIVGGAESAGGQEEDWQSPGIALATAERYSPGSGEFSQLGPMLNHPRQRHTAVPIGDGPDQVLICGGVETAWDPDTETGGTPVSTCELYDTESGIFTDLQGPPLEPGGGGMSAITLEDGRVLLFGGLDHGAPRGEIYLYTP